MDALTNALATCLCWDDQKRDWCTTDQCNAFVTYSVLFGVPALFSVMGLTVYILNYVMYKCTGRPFCCEQLCCGSATRLLTHRPSGLLSYRITTLFTLTVMACGGAALTSPVMEFSSKYESIMMQLSGESKLNATEADLLDVVEVVRHLVKELNDAKRSIDDQDPAATKAVQAAERSAGSICSWVENTIATMSAIHDNMRWLYAVVWAPVGVAFLVFLLSILSYELKKAVVICMVALAVLTAVPMYALQLTSGVMTVGLEGLCRDYSTVDASAAGYFRYRVGNSSTFRTLSNSVTTCEDLYYNTTCGALRTPEDPIHEACAEYFSCPTHGCATFNDISSFYSASKLVRAETDRGTCTGQCTILECAANCVVGSRAQQLSSVLTKTFYAVTQHLSEAHDAAASLRNGSQFLEVVDDLKVPLCDAGVERRLAVIAGRISTVSSVLSVCAWLLVMLACALQPFSEVAGQLRASEHAENDLGVLLECSEHYDHFEKNYKNASQERSRRRGVETYASVVLPKSHSVNSWTGQETDAASSPPADYNLSDSPAAGRAPRNLIIDATGGPM
eukprot:TRINITY_DN17955_c0_g1_i1.p1 TRINITY_DN17955_c0_g1~~TRINITY_DN17955_c0_g1_i1.p1  ORF type:complete len:563 (+),score=43.81 TRINITY_DN17955_c0_g1_i1:62-1750(+)